MGYASSYHALALTNDGELLAFGDNEFGQLSDSMIDSYVPRRVRGYLEGDIPESVDGPCDTQTPANSNSICIPTVTDQYTCDNDPFCANFSDDSYDGTLASMRCVPVAVSILGTIDSVSVELTLEHESAGELVIKLVHPDGLSIPLLSRPGLTETNDDGSECCGSTDPLSASWPLTFVEGAATSAEDMAAGATFICEDTSPCEFEPAAGAALPDNSISALNGLGPNGLWQVCVGDAGSSGVGAISLVNLTINVIDF